MECSAGVSRARPAIVTDWYTKDSTMCYHAYVIMHVKDAKLFVIRLGHHVLVVGFFLTLYGLHTLNGRDK